MKKFGGKSVVSENTSGTRYNVLISRKIWRCNFWSRATPGNCFSRLSPPHYSWVDLSFFANERNGAGKSSALASLSSLRLILLLFPPRMIILAESSVHIVYLNVVNLRISLEGKIDPVGKLYCMKFSAFLQSILIFLFVKNKCIDLYVCS